MSGGGNKSPKVKSKKNKQLFLYVILKKNFIQKLNNLKIYKFINNF